MAIVYGDSTPFPYGDNFIEISADLIDCCVALFHAQYNIALSAAAIRERELHRQTEQGRLEAITEAVRGAVTTATGDHARRLVAPVFEAAKALIDRESAELEAQIAQEIAASRAQAEEAKQSTYRIIETFALKHTLPGTLLELRIVASEKGYATKIFQVTPFGVEALFSTSVPSQSDWARHRRVGDIHPGTEMQMPLSAGWLSKRIEIQAVRLDKLFVSEVSLSEEKSTICLRKNPTSGGGYLIEIISSPPPKVTIATLGEDGLPIETARSLDDGDYINGLRFWAKLAPSTHGLNRRQAMLSATANKKPLQENDTPESIGLRLIQNLAPILKEIAKRSSTPGELVLRRDLGGGRREELYATKAQFFEKIKGLPENFQRYFEPLELSGEARASNASPSLPPRESLLKPSMSAPPGQTIRGVPLPSPSQSMARNVPIASPSPAPVRNVPTASPSQSPARHVPTASPSQSSARHVPTASPSQSSARNVPIASPSPAPVRNAPTASPSGKLSVQTSIAPTLLEVNTPLEPPRSIPESAPAPVRSMPTLIIDSSLSLPMATIIEMGTFSEESIAALLDDATQAVVPPSYITQEVTAVSATSSTVASFAAVSLDEEALRDLEDSTPSKR